MDTSLLSCPNVTYEFPNGEEIENSVLTYKRKHEVLKVSAVLTEKGAKL